MDHGDTCWSQYHRTKGEEEMVIAGELCGHWHWCLDSSCTCIAFKCATLDLFDVSSKTIALFVGGLAVLNLTT